MRDLGSRSFPDVAADVVLLPVGSLEQHGPHLPLDTDTRIAVAVAQAIARAIGGALVAPPIAYGSSGEHEGFPGTVSIGREALAAVLVEAGRSASAWARRLIFVNGHGGNLDVVRDATRVLRSEERGADWIPCAPGAGWEIDAHAGRTETSLLLHLAPETVCLDRAEPGETAPIESLLEKLVAGGVRAVSANGVLGNPTGASAAEGELLLAAMVDAGIARLSAEARP